MQIQEKTAGVAPGFIGIILNMETAATLTEYFKNTQGAYARVYDRLDAALQQNNPEIARMCLKGLISNMAKGQSDEFAKHCKKSGVAWMIKNVYKDPSSFWNFRSRVSNPKANYMHTNAYAKADKAWYRSAAVETKLYNWSKMDSKRNKNKETFREILCMQVAGACGFKVPETRIMVASYNSGREKFCIMTRWNPDLVFDKKCNEATLRGRYYAPIMAINDYDMIGSRFQNSVILSEEVQHDGVRSTVLHMFSFDFGHGLNGSSKKITNNKGFTTGTLDELIGALNLWRTIPRSYFTNSTNNGMELLNQAFEGYQDRLHVKLLSDSRTFDKIVLDYIGALKSLSNIKGGRSTVKEYVDDINKREYYFYSRALEVMRGYSYHANTTLRSFIKSYIKNPNQIWYELFQKTFNRIPV
ncbi:hypothetical protein JYG24_01640 [Lentisphaerota bacterium]|nr:hypothetical protein JYG24_01640 [Lentisphaerota bacterium]